MPLRHERDREKIYTRVSGGDVDAAMRLKRDFEAQISYVPWRDQ
jgi:hypothetical protein